MLRWATNLGFSVSMIGESQERGAAVPHALSSPEEIEHVCMRNLLASSAERVFFKDLESRFLLVSEGFVAELGQGSTLADVIGRTDFDFFTAPHADNARADEIEIIRTGNPIVGKLECETFRDRPDRWVSTTKWPLRGEDGEIIGTFGISRDVTGQIEAQNKLAHQALHDPVTGLANRIALTDRLAQALVALEHRAGRIALLCVDLDDFKGINDTLGHDTGDQVLIEVARRLRHVARRIDTVARPGGDEFVLLCTGMGRDEDLRLLCDRVMRSLRKPFCGKQELAVSCSLGAVTTDDPQVDPGELLQRADFAMHMAKRAGRNRVELYDSELHGAIASSRGLLVELPSAIAAGQLFLLYQPLFRIDDGALTGVEALVRWQHPERGLLSPAEFIPLAEQHGQIGLIDAFVLDQACRQLAAWTKADPAWATRTVAVNLSGAQLWDPQLAGHVLSVLERHQIAPSRLCLEITETALIGKPDEISETIASLTDRGIRIALDDFGTGYSTLAHLQHLQADVLKIDRSFIARIGDRSRDREIIAAITAMAHALGMTVVSEGIETAAQHGEVAALGCDEGQGYLLAPPLPAPQVAALSQRALP
jgi:diguanylate cyclase (GGDEF)-like protein/PAS domain S-box-containing protein